MWTIVYTDQYGNEHYDRLSKAELYDFIVANHLEDDEDMLIFPPECEMDVFAFLGSC